MVAANTENNIRSLEERLSREEEAAARSLAIVGNDAQAKAFIEQDLANKRAVIEKQIADQKRKQFIFDRAVNAGEIIFNTASGISKAVAASPLTFGLPWSAFVGATGALQLARLFAAPIPQFAKGVENFEGGAAIVGEKGSELIKEGNRFRLSPSKPTLTNLKKGADVIPHKETMQILAMAGLQNSLSEGGTSYNFTKLENKLDSVGTKIESAIKRIPSNVWDEKGYRQYQRTESGRIQRLNKRFSK
jgi:hypothetical protein